MSFVLRRSTLAIVFGLAACASQTESANKILAEIAFPFSESKAVIFERAGNDVIGATTHVSVLPIAEDLSDEPGNVFIADSADDGTTASLARGIKVKWLDAKTLKISYSGATGVYRNESSFGSVAITYEIREGN